MKKLPFLILSIGTLIGWFAGVQAASVAIVVDMTITETSETNSLYSVGDRVTFTFLTSADLGPPLPFSNQEESSYWQYHHSGWPLLWADVAISDSTGKWIPVGEDAATPDHLLEIVRYPSYWYDPKPDDQSDYFRISADPGNGAGSGLYVKGAQFSEIHLALNFANGSFPDFQGLEWASPENALPIGETIIPTDTGMGVMSFDQGLSTRSDYLVTVDSVTFAVVPETSGMSLTALSLAWFFTCRRRSAGIH